MLKRQPFRALLAVVVGNAITVLVGLSVLLPALLYRLVLDWWASWRNPFTLVPHLWNLLMHRLVTAGIMRIPVVIEGELPRLAADETAIVIGNHPSVPGVPAVAWFVTTFIARRIVALAKAQHLLIPWFGWPIWAMKSGIFLLRSSSWLSRLAIQWGLSRPPPPPAAIVIFPDMRRPTPERIEKVCRQFEGKIPGLRQWLHWTGLPRPRGLQTIRKVLTGLKVRVFNLTCAFERIEWGLRDMPLLVGCVFRIHIEEVTGQIPQDEQELRNWLNESWKQKNARISGWRSRSLAPSPQPYDFTRRDACACSHSTPGAADNVRTAPNHFKMGSE